LPHADSLIVFVPSARSGADNTSPSFLQEVALLRERASRKKYCLISRVWP